jgi:hypothetical protein
LQRKLGGMSLPQTQPQAPLVAHSASYAERPDALRMLMEWIADRFRDAPEPDTSIDWEDGEEHDEPHGPPTL